MTLDNPCSHTSVEAPSKTQEFREHEISPQAQGGLQPNGQDANREESYRPIDVQDRSEASITHFSTEPTIEETAGVVQDTPMEGNLQETPADLADIILHPL